MNDDFAFTPEERAAVYRAIAERRDMRHFRRGAQVTPEDLARLLHTAHQAPSVGLMQPWRFIRVTDPALRQAIHVLVETERQHTAEALGDRGEDFMRLKVEGILDCAELLVAVLAPDDGTVFGRRTLPEEMALCSCACAIQNLWLAARAEGLGLGWVSLFEPSELASLLRLPEGAKPIAVLCLGPVERFYSAPMLSLKGWRQPRPLQDMVMENHWQEERADR